LSIVQGPFSVAPCLRYASQLLHRCMQQVYRKATLRWHPDKFVGKFGKLMAPADEESIMNNVKNISQGINRSWQIASY
jgi:hypothetical protein